MFYEKNHYSYSCRYGGDTVNLRVMPKIHKAYQDNSRMADPRLVVILYDRVLYGALSG